MNKIQVKLLKPSEKGRLYYRPDPQIHPFVFYVESPQKEKKRSYSINIDSAIIIDLDQDFLIQSVEFNIHKKVWLPTPDLSIPEISMPADIQVSNLKRTDELIEKHVTARTNIDFSIASFSWMDLRPDGKWINLSEQCIAYVVHQYLGGFIVRFP